MTFMLLHHPVLESVQRWWLLLLQMFECIVCDKLYKSEKALKNHEASKKHKEQLKKFKQMMKDEDKLNLDDLSLHD